MATWMRREGNGWTQSNGAQEKSEAVSGRDCGQGVGAGTGGRSSGREGGSGEKEEAGETQTDIGQIIGRSRVAKRPAGASEEGCTDGNVRVHRHVAGGPRDGRAAHPPAAKCVPHTGSSGESYRGARRERGGTGGSAIYAARRAHDNAICTTGYAHGKIVRTPTLRAAETGWAVHSDCGRVAHNQVGAVFEGGENVANAAAEARRDHPFTGDLNHLRIVRLPVDLISNVCRMRRMHVGSKSLEVKKQVGVGGEEGAG